MKRMVVVMQQKIIVSNIEFMARFKCNPKIDISHMIMAISRPKKLIAKKDLVLKKKLSQYFFINALFRPIIFTAPNHNYILI